MAQTLSQTELQKLVPSDDAARGFGRSMIALSGDRALIGAGESRGDGGFASGAAYLYERDVTGTWVEVARLTPPPRSRDMRFGFSVALSGDRALVGTRRDGRGAAFVFERDATGTWVEVAKLTASDFSGPRRDGFGNSVSLAGDRALIGAQYGIDDTGTRSGVAYVYERDEEGTWVEVAKLTASDAARNDFFGESVALSGDRALIGAAGKNGIGHASGVAYVYERDGTGAWVEVARLAPLDPSEEGNFGNSVQLSDDRALVGAWGVDGDSVVDGTAERSGAAYVYERDGAGMWVEAAKLTASDARGYDLFGSSVALSGDRALIAAPGKIVAARASGAAYVYERDETGTWVEAAKLAASDGAPGDLFGGEYDSVALLGDTALVGAGSSGVAGAAYVFDLAEGNDEDQDGIVDAVDNCPVDFNPRQENFDEDLVGDVCDPDDDNDGVDDADDPFPLDPDRTLPPLILDQVDPAVYGFRLEGTGGHTGDLEVLERSFEASASDLLLTLTGYDIDIADEVRVLVNGTPIGFLSRTPDNGRAITQLPIARGLLSGSGNTLRFEQTRRFWRWGVTDLLLSEIGTLPPLVLDQVDSAEYGFRFEGVTTHGQALARQFDAGDADDLVLTLTGYDIDTSREVRVLVNGTPIGFLSRTPDNGRGPSRFTIARSLLSSSGNTLRLRQRNDGWIWGVTDLLLERRR